MNSCIWCEMVVNVIITNALRSWRANVFVECQLMLSDKCLKLSQGSCPSFRLCHMSPLVEEDNSYTGGDWAVCSLKGLTLPYGATIRWKKEYRCFIKKLRGCSSIKRSRFEGRILWASKRDNSPWQKGQRIERNDTAKCARAPNYNAGNSGKPCLKKEYHAL